MPPSRALSPRASGLLALLALALLVRALTPIGWMPHFENGTVTLRLCSGFAPVPGEHRLAQYAHEAMNHGAAAEHKHRGHEKESGGPQQPCPFAIAALGSSVPPQPVLPTETFAVAPALLFPVAVAIGSGLAAPPPPSTGPPLLS